MESAAELDDAAGQSRPDEGEFRRVMSHFCSGLTIITATTAGGAPIGMTCQSFLSLSLDPPLIAVAPAITSTTYPQIRSSRAFAVNVLAQDQQDIAARFALRSTDRWQGVDWRPGMNGAPLIVGSLAHIECRIEIEHVLGDHYLVAGRVERLADDPSRMPLLFFRRAFTVLHEDNCRLPLTTNPGPRSIP
jgi:Conserved protein/domain typically associated with flavoprotein oxygenases, DIM6/NTAB family